jgi:YfiH family protein
VPARLKALWDQKKPQWKQVHGTAIARASKAGEACGEVDALWTSGPGGWVGSVTADCVPVLMAARDGSAVAAIHAGWRGTLARIIEHAWQELSGQGFDPRGWVAAIGPSIRSCCFEVGEDVQQKFVSEFAEFSKASLNPRHRHLDLQWLNAQVLLRIGVAEVDILPFCTRCAKDESGQPLFHSFRREGGGTRQISVIGIN